MYNGQYLIAANSKKGQLIFNIFRKIDLIIAISGATVTVIMFFILQSTGLGSTWLAVLTLLPLFTCAFLVFPVANYHNVMCVLGNVYKYYFVERQQFKWKGWCAKYEFKD